MHVEYFCQFLIEAVIAMLDNDRKKAIIKYVELMKDTKIRVMTNKKN